MAYANSSSAEVERFFRREVFTVEKSKRKHWWGGTKLVISTESRLVEFCSGIPIAPRRTVVTSAQRAGGRVRRPCCQRTPVFRSTPTRRFRITDPCFHQLNVESTLPNQRDTPRTTTHQTPQSLRCSDAPLNPPQHHGPKSEWHSHRTGNNLGLPCSQSRLFPDAKEAPPSGASLLCLAMSISIRHVHRSARTACSHERNLRTGS
jgi:hypothetical protein